jgi:two-component system chemotaxis response regulator CheB
MAIEFIAIGTSLGGVKALTQIFTLLPAKFTIPIAVVIHRAPMQNDYLVSTLQKSTSLYVQEAIDKQSIDSTNIIIAPADYHLLVDNGHYALSVEGPVEHARPSIILTGGGRDGVRGLELIKRHGGSVLIESPETAEDPTLPQAAIDAELAGVTYPIEKLVSKLLDS